MNRPKSRVWDFFKPDEDNKKYAICSLCNAKISRGSDIPKKQTTKAMEHHLNFSHADKFKVSKPKESETENEPSGSQGLKRAANDDNENAKLFNLRSKKERKTMLFQTIPGWVESQSKLEFNSQRAQKIHKSIFEMNILDKQPWTMVNDPGFIRLLNVLEPRFEIASDKYYREMLEPSHLAIKTKLMEMLEKDNPKTISVALDGWSAHHHGYLGINYHYITDWKRKKLNLACKPFDERHTGVNIYNCLEAVLTEW